jgi:hypothetical protein
MRHQLTAKRRRCPMLQADTEVRVAIKVGGEGLEINDLAAWAFEAKNAWTQQLLAEVLWQMQEQHVEAVLEGMRELACPGCGVIHSGAGTILRRGSRPRKVRTSNGPIRFRLRQLTCSACRKTWSPFPELLGLAPGQRILEEFTRRLVDWVTELSYAKTCRMGREWVGDAPSPKTLHREVQRCGAEVTLTEAGPLGTVMADGTKVPAGTRPRGEDLSVAFQLQGRATENGRTAVEKRVVGFSVGWGHWQETLATEGTPSLLVTDGEPGLRELARMYFPGVRHQLCEWHVPHTLGRMLGKDGMEIEARRRITGKVSGILARGGEAARSSYRKLTDSLSGYPSAHTLLCNAEPNILYTPPSAERTTSVMEREMREVNRRTDIGARWSVSGITNLVRLRVAKRHNPDDYARLWSPLRKPAFTTVSLC